MAEENLEENPEELKSTDPEGDDETSIEDILDSIRQIISEDDDEGEAEAEQSSSDVEPEPPVEDDGEDAINDADIAEVEDFVPEAEVDSEPEPEPQPEEPANEDSLDAEDLEDVIDLVDKVEDEPEVAVEPESEPTPEPEPEQDIPPEPEASDPVVEEVHELESEPEAEIDMQDLEDGIMGEVAAGAALEGFENLVKKTAVEHNGITIEDIVRTELKPLLREWLDNHLPSMIERLVAEELERLSKRALGED